jgi:Methylase of polypeptide chain release factors
MTGWAIDRLGKMDVAEPVVADLGTGSGAIALAIGQEVPRARVHAVEADPIARAWAERNVSKYVESDPYTAGRVMLHAGDLTDALSELDGAVDLVISNPPYIPVGAYVEPEVSEYDPPAALWSGTDGLDAIRALERTARRLLRPGGLLAVEHGAQQGRRCTGCSQKSRAGGTPATTRTWPAVTALSPPPGRVREPDEQALRLPGSAGADRGIEPR